MRERLRASRAARALRALPYAALYRVAVLTTKPRSGRVLFLTDSHDGFTGNLAAIRDAMLAQDPQTDIRSSFKGGLRAQRRLLDIVRLPFLMATSPVIVLDDFYPVIYGIPLRRGTRLIQVWHAAGAFKRVGHSRAGLPGGPTPGSTIHRNYTDAFVSSERIRGDYAEAFGIDISRVRALGVARTDFFFDDALLEEARARVRLHLGVAPGEKLVLFAPTFRGNGQLSAFADETADWSKIAQELGEGWRVAVRLHPFTRYQGGRPVSPVIDASIGVDMNELLAATDVLITDYSSSIFEFGLLRRPIVFFVPDLDEYAEARSFYRPFDAYAIGPVVQDPSGIVDAVRSAAVGDETFTAFLDEFCGSLDGHSSERIAAELIAAAGTPHRLTARSARVSRIYIVAAYAARLALAIGSAMMIVLPRQRKITMITREHSTTPLDFVLLREAIRRADPQVAVTTMARRLPPGILRKVGYALSLLVEMYHVATSRVLVVDGYSIVASGARHSDGLTIVQVWHALGALKKFGLSIVGRPEGRDPRLSRLMRMHHNYDVVIASAEACRIPYAEAFGSTPENVKIAPLPRVDHLRDPAVRERAGSRFESLYPELIGKQTALYAPTFRAGGSQQCADPLAVTRAMADAGFATITKLHPLLAAPQDPELRTAPGMSTQEVLLVADIFITDYSSTVFEAAVAGVPSYLLAPDLDGYVTSRDFYLRYDIDLGLPISHTVEELAQRVTRGEATQDQLRSLRDRYVTLPQREARTAAADQLAAIVLGGLTHRMKETT